MADIYKGELQDNLGNTVYPHTEADVVFCADGKTAQEKLAGYENALGSVTGTSGSLEVNDANILATTEATKKLSDNLTKVKTYVGSDGKLHFVDASGADTVLPFSSEKFVSLTNIGSGSLGNGTGSTSTFTFTIPVTCDFIVYYITNTNIQNGDSVAATGNFNFSGLNSNSVPTHVKGHHSYFVVIYRAIQGNTFSLSNIGQAYGAIGSYYYAYGNYIES